MANVGIHADTPDDQLVLLYKNGDNRAFEALYGRYKGVIINFSYRMSGDRALAADVLQETFVYFIRSLRSYRPEGKFKMLVFKVARSITISKLRKMRRSAFSDVDVDSLASRDVESAFEKAESAGFLKEQLHSAMAELSDEFKEVLLLRFEKGLSYDDISQIIDRPEGTVKSRLHNAIAALRKIVGKSLDKEIK